MDVVCQIIFFCFMSFIALWSGMVVTLSFRDEDIASNTHHGIIFLGSLLSLATAAIIAIYRKTNNTTITVLSLIICLFILVPIITAYFIARKRITKRWAERKLYDTFYDKLIVWAVEKESFSEKEYDDFVDSLILSETPCNGYPHSEYKNSADNPNFNIYMDAAKSFAYYYPKTFVIDKERGYKPNVSKNSAKEDSDVKTEGIILS